MRSLLLILISSAFISTACDSQNNNAVPIPVADVVTEEMTADENMNTETGVEGIDEDSNEEQITGEEPETSEGDENMMSLGACRYTNPFSGQAECVEYWGSGWTTDSIESECDDVLGGPGELTLGVGCAENNRLGYCLVEVSTNQTARTVSQGREGDCAATRTGCETFAGGTFIAEDICLGGDAPNYEEELGTDDGNVGTGNSVYVLPYEQCQEPLEGDVSTDGEVCTQVAIQGCTEPGLHYADYAVCEDVLSQRPYWSNPYPITDNADDSRLTDEDYQRESEWVKSEVESCACVCCHSESRTPEGVGQWDTEAGPLWADTFSDTGLAMMAGWVSSTAFGEFDAEMNHGFDRSRTGAPSTDPDRMIAFFESELDRRGLDRADFTDTPEFGAFMYAFTDYEPEACPQGIGVSTGGVIDWGDSPARYVYVLEVGSTSPAAPPTFDMPEGVLYRVQVPSNAQPLNKGLRIDNLPNRAVQVFPENRAAPNLIPGETYYLHVSSDMLVPVQRCLFVY